MSFQTQVVDEATLSAEINAQRMVKEYKEWLADLRVQRVSAIQEKLAVRDYVLDILKTRDELIELFKSEVQAMNPAIVDVGQALREAAPNSELAYCWQDYQGKLLSVVGKLEIALQDYKWLTQEIANLEQKENSVLSSYSETARAAIVPVPTPEEMTADLVQFQIISTEDDAAIFARIPAIELLTPQAADQVMLEQVNIEEQNKILSAQSSIQTMVATGTAAQQTDLKPVGLIAGLMALAYIIFGG